MSKSIQPDQLGDALGDLLTVYAHGVADGVNAAGEESVKKLVKLTKRTAPVGARGDFKRRIAFKELDAAHGMKRYVWHVRPPDHRLTHLLVHGHATKDGGRTKPDPFLADALAAVLPEYEKAVEEAVKNGG